MRVPQRLRPYWDPIVQLVLWLRSCVFAFWLGLRNRTSHAPATGGNGPVVCLTSYGSRVASVHLTLESIARGSLLPSRLILWLDDAAIFGNLPLAVRRLQARGVEVCLTTNWGPHTKYYPWIESQRAFDRPLVTADDDILYPRAWLEGLARAFAAAPDRVNCYRARIVRLQDGKLTRYEDWLLSRSMLPGYRNFATGVSGVIYPPAMQAAIQAAGTAFMQCCPKADDLWLHVQALRAGFPVQQIVPRALHFLLVPGTQRLALQNSNRGEVESGNDRQAAATYTEADLAILKAAIGDLHAPSV